LPNVLQHMQQHSGVLRLGEAALVRPGFSIAAERLHLNDHAAAVEAIIPQTLGRANQQLPDDWRGLHYGSSQNEPGHVDDEEPQHKVLIGNLLKGAFKADPVKLGLVY